ncbi:MAG TPA: helix-turn-helix transcriptional regulator [Anaerolineae bacterium]|nr:helix-turn-helix transcriptional regulator [Anaerolineae bacterium]
MLGKVLRDARIAADLTQEELAYRAGLDRTYISLLEHDRKSPTMDVLFRLAKALGVKASVLIAKVERESVGRKRS